MSTVALTLGMRVFYATEKAGPPDEDGWPTVVPDVSDMTDTGTVTERWADGRGRSHFAVTWDKWQEGSDGPDLDEARSDGELISVNGWALPLPEQEVSAP